MNIREGEKVHYKPEHDKNEYENGIIKTIPHASLDSVFVVYNCNDDWDNYRHYTAQFTNIKDLYLGWPDDS